MVIYLVQYLLSLIILFTKKNFFMKKYLVILFVFFVNIVYSQKTNRSIKLKILVEKDSVMLRWVPSTYDLWKKGNEFGYKIEKIALTKGVENKIFQLHTGVIKPLKLKEWGKSVKVDSTWSPIALQCLYGETLELTTSFNKNITEVYSKFKENEYRYGFALYCADRSIIASKSLGLYFSERNVHPGKYLYKIYINTPNKNEGIDTTYVLVDTDKITEFIKPEKPTVEQYNSRSLLSWESLGFDYVGYSVERSEDGKVFRKISKDIVVPFMNKNKSICTYIDSAYSQTGYCFYRVKGITPFQIEGHYSDTSRVYVKENIHSPHNVITTLLKSGIVKITWDFDDVNVIGFKVLRSSKIDGEYNSISDKIMYKERMWVDKHPQSNNYYKIIALGKSGQAASSLVAYISLPDEEPPLSPVDLNCKIESNGKIMLNWESNLEEDLLGYKVYRSFSENRDYCQINRGIDKNNYFTDSIDLKILNKKVYYKLVSVDKRYNCSDFSKVYSFNIPDLVKPAPPIIQNIDALASGNCIKWIPSVSKDVINYDIYSYDNADSVFVANVKSNVNQYIDSSKIRQGGRCYKMIASDGNLKSNVSNSYCINSKSIMDSVAVIELKYKLINIKNDVYVNLFINDRYNDNDVFIYKSENDKYKLIKNIRGRLLDSFMDKYKQGEKVQYFVRVKKNNALYITSNTIKVGSND